MIKESNKYESVLNVLKKSKPVFNDAEAVSERVIAHIREEKSRPGFTDLILEFFFGWVYIGWVRRSMVTAAMIIIVIFGYQQAQILRRIDGLPIQKAQNETSELTNSTDELSNTLLLYKLTGKKLSTKEIQVTEKEIDQLIRSVNKLQLKYHDLFYLIENDPQLKKYVEEKMNESTKKN